MMTPIEITSQAITKMHQEIYYLQKLEYRNWQDFSDRNGSMIKLIPTTGRKQFLKKGVTWKIAKMTKSIIASFLYFSHYQLNCYVYLSLTVKV